MCIFFNKRSFGLRMCVLSFAEHLRQQQVPAAGPAGFRVQVGGVSDLPADGQREPGPGQQRPGHTGHRQQGVRHGAHHRVQAARICHHQARSNIKIHPACFKNFVLRHVLNSTMGVTQHGAMSRFNTKE